MELTSVALGSEALASEDTNVGISDYPSGPVPSGQAFRSCKPVSVLGLRLSFSAGITLGVFLRSMNYRQLYDML
jgi:hypothetical protein